MDPRLYHRRLGFPSRISQILLLGTGTNQNDIQIKGTKIIQMQDQDSTDFQKCLSFIKTHDPSIQTWIVLGALGGRLDHCMASIHTLHTLPDKRIFLFSNESLAFLLTKGQHTIKGDTTLVGPTCGLLPIGVPEAILTTQGLKWNLGL